MNSHQKAASWFMLFLVIFWAVLMVAGIKEGFYNYLFSFLFGLTPLVAGIIAILSCKMWGGTKSAIGKAVLFVGIGIFLWGMGELIWSYYNFVLNVPAPYPSIADIGFAPSIFFYGLGAFYLSRATGAKFALRKTGAKIVTFLAVPVLFVVAYYVLVIVARGGVLLPEGETPLKTILDIAYPLGDFLGLVVAAIVSGLSFRYLGGKYIFDIYAILLGLFVMFVADTIFSYTTTAGTYYNANFGDLILTIGTFLLSYGVLGFCKMIKSEA